MSFFRRHISISLRRCSSEWRDAGEAAHYRQTTSSTEWESQSRIMVGNPKRQELLSYRTSLDKTESTNTQQTKKSSKNNIDFYIHIIYSTHAILWKRRFQLLMILDKWGLKLENQGKRPWRGKKALFNHWQTFFLFLCFLSTVFMSLSKCRTFGLLWSRRFPEVQCNWKIFHSKGPKDQKPFYCLTLIYSINNDTNTTNYY